MHRWLNVTATIKQCHFQKTRGRGGTERPKSPHRWHGPASRARGASLLTDSEFARAQAGTCRLVRASFQPNRPCTWASAPFITHHREAALCPLSHRLALLYFLSSPSQHHPLHLHPSGSSFPSFCLSNEPITHVHGALSVT